MNTNNFDTSSTGLNLELSIYWDSVIATHYFEESFNILHHSTIKQNSVLVFNQYGNFDFSDFDLSDLDNYTCNKTELIALIKECFYYDDVILQQSHDLMKHSLNKSDNQDLIDFVQDTMKSHFCLSDIIEYYQEFFTPTYKLIHSFGHSQGHYSVVILPKKLLDCYRADNKAESDQMIVDCLQKDIDHLLWDAPLFAKLTIDDDDIYLDEFQDDSYSYNKEKTIKFIKDNLEHEGLDYIINWLSENLPEQPEYRI